MLLGAVDAKDLLCHLELPHQNHVASKLLPTTHLIVLMDQVPQGPSLASPVTKVPCLCGLNTVLKSPCSSQSSDCFVRPSSHPHSRFCYVGASAFTE